MNILKTLKYLACSEIYKKKIATSCNHVLALKASGPITSWQIDGDTMETVTDYFGGLQNHCRW